METVTIHHRPDSPRSADLMLRMAIMARSPSWPSVTPYAAGCFVRAADVVTR
jgi:hypothetical protein